MKPFFSILLPTYNRLNSLKEILLPSLEHQTFQNFEFVVVDDHGSDGTEQYFNSEAYRKDFPKLSQVTRYYRNQKNMGSPSSRNVGFKQAKAGWIFMTEDDLQISYNHFLEKAKEQVEKLTATDPSIAVICPKRKEYIGGYYKNYNHKFVNFGFLSREVYLDPDQEYSGYTESAQACSIFRTSLAQELLYDIKDYKYFREESDFYERVKRAGFKIYYVGDVLKTDHRMDLVVSGGNRKHSVSLKNEFKYISSHYVFISKYFSFAPLRIVFFVLARCIKHFANLTKLKFIKNALSFVRL